MASSKYAWLADEFRKHATRRPDLTLEEFAFEWMADEFRKQVAQAPHLTVDDFVLRYGVPPKWIRRRFKLTKNIKTRQKWEENLKIGIQNAGPIFQGQTIPSADLTLEEFAIQHGVQPKTTVKRAAEYYDVTPQVIRDRIDNDILIGNWIAGSWFVALDTDGTDDEREPNAITLWHGTTEERAKAIIKDGFKPKMPRAGIWFTAKPSFARQFAGRRSYNRTRVPIVFCCDINLEANRDILSQPSRFHIYVFDVPRLKCRIRHIEILEKDHPPTPTHRTANTDVTDVAITRTAGRLGVLWWINRFLELNNEKPLDENHLAVKAVFQWLTTQYDNDRIDAISDDEMLVQVMRHLK